MEMTAGSQNNIVHMTAFLHVYTAAFFKQFYMWMDELVKVKLVSNIYSMN